MVGGVGRSNSIGGRGVGDVRRQQQQPHIVEYNATLNQGQQIQMQQIQHPQIQQQVQGLLLHPLTLDTAVEIAVLNNKSLQAELFALGVSASDD